MTTATAGGDGQFRIGTFSISKFFIYHNRPKYEVINIDLTSKPAWFLERNPLGKVPTLEEPGKKPLFESLIVAEYIDEKYPGGRQILPKNPYEKARQRVLIEVVSQNLIPHFYGVIFNEGRQEGLNKGLEEIEKMLTTKYFAGDSQGYVDLMVFPWFERLPALSAVRGGFEFTSQRYPKLLAWTQAMLSDPDVKATTFPQHLLEHFMCGYSGQRRC